MFRQLTLACFVMAFCFTAAEAQEPTSKPQSSELFKRFEKLLNGSTLRGSFTLDGKPLNELHEESYEIQKVEKLPDGDQWSITARIKYGAKDLVVPVPLDVKWAGQTPVLTLDDLTIPGMGTFSARILLHKDRYAGTWQHDDKGGHMFGKIIFAEEKPAK